MLPLEQEQTETGSSQQEYPPETSLLGCKWTKGNRGQKGLPKVLLFLF